MKLRLSIKIAMAVALVGVLAAIGIPNYIKVRMAPSGNICINRNLWAIYDAKKRWAEETGKPPGAVPEERDLLPYLPGRQLPVCPSGGKYDIGPIGSNPSCSLTNEHPWTPK